MPRRKVATKKQKQELSRYLNDPNVINEDDLFKQLISPEMYSYIQTTAAKNIEQIYGKKPNLYLDPTNIEREWIGGKYAEEVARMIRMTAIDTIDTLKPHIVRTVCNDFQYCRKKAEGAFTSEEMQVGMAVLDGLLSIALSVPLPLTMLSAYIVRRGLLDKWCEC